MIKIIANGAYAASFPLISFLSLANSSMESRTILTKQIYFIGPKSDQCLLLGVGWSKRESG